MRKGWEYKKFEEVFDLQMGKTPDRKNLEYFGGNNVWVSIRDLGEKEISESKEHITDVAVADTNIKVVPKGTVIMSFKLTVGKCGIASRDLYTNEAIMAFNIKDGYDINSSFLYYYLQGYQWEGANKAVMGITLNKATISKHTIAIPPLPIQQSIVAELDEINDLLSLKRKELETYDKLAQSFFYEMFGDPSFETKTLDEIYNFIDYRGKTPNKINSGIPLVTAKNVRKGYLDYTIKDFISLEEYNDRQTRGIAKKGDLLFTTEAPLGYAAVADLEEYSAGQRVIALQSKGDNIVNTYAMYYILSDAFQYELSRQATGSTAQGIKASKLKNMSIPLPPLPLQQLFAARIEAIEKQKANVKTAIEKLEILLAARMQYWFE